MFSKKLCRLYTPVSKEHVGGLWMNKFWEALV